jgi:ubiquitin carboxyl-terminal hydrolase 4/11/15
MGPYVLSERGADGAVEPLLYDCFGVVNHYGSMAFGHYTASTNHFVARGYVDAVGEHWHHYDDSSVRRMDPSEVVDRSAYLLFYRRRVQARGDPVAKI